MHQKTFPVEDERQLLLQLSEGSKLAFDILYEKHFKTVFNSAYKRLNNVQAAEDIAQEVFVQLWLRGSKVPIENLKAYLFVLVKNNVFRFIEKEAKYTTLPDLAIQIEDPLDRADAILLHEEFLKNYNQLIEALPAQQRLIFKMRFDQDLTSSEIAEKLQISPKTVRNQLGKSLSTLRNSLMIIQIFFLLINNK
jgi:RNA polymerase sigma-70 factor (family 1)